MNVKGRITEFRKQLVSGQLPVQSPQAALGLNWGLNFLLGFVLSCAKVFGSYGPFGIAAAAQAGSSLGGLFCTLGAAAGYLITLGLSRGIKYVAAVVLVFTAGYVFKELPVVKKQWFMPLIAFGFTLVAGFLGAIDAVSTSPVYLPVIMESVLALGCTYFFREALSAEERSSDSAELRHGISLVILFACVLLAVVPVTIFDIVSVGRFLALLVVLTAAFKGGALSGAAAGTALGVVLDIASGGSAFYTMAYAFSGLISGVFAKRGKLPFLVSFIVTNLVAVLLSIGSVVNIMALYETFAASVIFMILPASFLNYAGAFLKPAQLTASESGLRRYAARRIHNMGEAFRDLYDTVDANVGAAENDEDISKVFDKASDSVCVRCKKKNECWNGNYMDTLAAFNDTVPAINNRGLVMKSDLPGHFQENCLSPDELVSAINGELRARLYRRQFRARLAENRLAAYSQYFDMSRILEDVSEELQNAYGPDVLAQRRLTRFLNSIDLEADVSVFRDRSGRLRIVMESPRLRTLLREPGYLDKLSGVVGVRLCRPGGDELEGRVLLMEAEPLSASVGIATMKKKGESVSGDRGTYFKTDQGILYVILSDGMGSGEDAAKESVSAVRILERFLKSGVDPAVAMKMLNSMMLLKNGEQWGFASVDLMCVDLFSGEAGFYKFGAAPSYVKSGRTVRRIRNEALAAGLTAGDTSNPDVVKMRLKPGNVALIASDGVLAETDDGWVRKMLMDFEGGDTKKLAREALQGALSQYGCIDDMTVLAVRLENRE